MGIKIYLYFSEPKMKVLQILLLVCMIGLAYQQAMWNCAKVQVQNQNGQVTKWRYRARQGAPKLSGWCVRMVHRRMKKNHLMSKLVHKILTLLAEDYKPC